MTKALQFKSRGFSAQDAVLLKCAFVWKKSRRRSSKSSQSSACDAALPGETSQSKVVTPAAGSGATKAVTYGI